MNLRQPLNGPAEELFEYSQTVPVIDTHEHVPLSEQAYNNTTMSFGQIFEPYITKSLRSAGMTFSKPGPPGFREMKEDWDALEPYWLATRHGSYTRPFRLALQKFYGVDDLTRENFRDVLEQINANNTPGIYERVFQDACGIEKSIVCAPSLPPKDDPIFKGNIISPSLRATSKQGIEDIAQDVGAPTVTSLDELLEATAVWMEKQVKENGAIEFKTMTWPVENPDREKAQAALNKILAEEKLENEEERELAVWLVVDASASCRIAAGGGAKWDTINELAALLTFSAIHNHDRVGIILCSDRVEQILQPRKGRQHALRLLTDLLSVQPRNKGSDPAPALDAILHMAQRRVLVLMLSDFLFDVDREQLGAVAFRHDLVGVAVNHPSEIEPPPCGLAAVRDSETGEALVADFGCSGKRGFAGRDICKRTFDARRTRLREEFAAVRADLLELDTCSDCAEELARFFRHRLRRTADETGG